MKDYLIKGLIRNGNVRVHLVSSTSVLNEAIKRHDCYPSSASCLGKIITMGLLIGANLKGDEAVTVKYNCNGPVGNIIADANGKGEIRAYLDHPHVNFVNTNGGLNEKMTLGEEGFLDVIKDLHLKDMFTSSIPATGNIANDFSSYFFQSEQTLSLIILSTVINPDNLASINGGIIIQLMPGYTNEDVEAVEAVAKSINSASDLFKNETLEDLALFLFPDFKFLDSLNVKFKCPCSKERFIQALETLPTSDLDEIIEAKENLHTQCQYCKEIYDIELDIVKEIRAKRK